MDLLDGTAGLVTYLGLKAGGYLIWSYVGVRWLSPGTRNPIRTGIALGLVRLILGWIVGAVLMPLGLIAATMGGLPIFYFTGLALVRWLEWGIIQSLIPRPGPGRKAVGLFTGESARGRLWRVIGVLVSYLADAPFLIAEGFPHGRFLC